MRRFCQIASVIGALGFLLVLASAQSTLNITRQGAAVSITWQATTPANVVLQQTHLLSASSGWTNVTAPVSLNNDAYQVSLSPADEALFFRLFNPPDEPDDGFVDSNGDGIDGDVSKAVFVSPLGSDTFPGTMGQPVRTIARGISLAAAAGKDVYVATGEYVSGTVSLSNNVSVYGGYNPNDWSRSDTREAHLTVTDAIGMVASNLAQAGILDHLTITGGDAVDAGGSAYGVIAIASPGLRLQNCTVQAGSGAAGLGGGGGVAGTNGVSGGPGAPGCENSTLFCSTCPVPPGGVPGFSACGNNGGVGGQPGLGAAGGMSGGIGIGGTPGGAGASCSGSIGCSGVQGNEGAAGAAGGEGGGGGAGTVQAAGYAPLNGGDGFKGGDGKGGGGGGGGGGGTANCDSYGSSGGGGGGGGCGGEPGKGGQSGGGSFALYFWNTDALVSRCALTTGNGGAGGNGGPGGPGGTGGAGGPGGPYGGSSEQDDGGMGAPGGKGGDGGRGGHGGGGAGGHSIGIVLGGTSQPSLYFVTFDLGEAGVGGSSPGNAGQSGVRATVYP